MSLRVAMAQLNLAVGAIGANVDAILGAWKDAADAGADLIVFPELAITGYPPEDLLLKPEFVHANLDALDRLAVYGPDHCVAVVGHVGGDVTSTAQEDWDVTISARDLHNSASVLADGEIVTTYVKRRLPNYGVFDEGRYFTPADEPVVIRIAGVTVGIAICEDLWTERGPLARAADAGASVLVVPNASPYSRGKRAHREGWARHHATAAAAPLVWVNLVGGQDDVVFDGDSFVVGPDGEPVVRAAQFREDLVLVDLDVERSTAPSVVVDVAGAAADRQALDQRTDTERLDPVAEVWEALVLATRDYCHKNGFEDAVIGLSGGIDSAVTATIAAEALGAEHVTGVAMPSPHSSQHSIDDAMALGRNLGIEVELVPIDGAIDAVEDTLAPLFAGTEPGVAEENIQARLRGLVLMALSNKFGSILLTTGNKTELAVGYATLYGDMAGGFAVLKDVPKLLVYELAGHANRDRERIPRNTIEKPPSAELRPDQTDQDTLPPYDVLDDIVAAYVELDLGVAEIVERGHDVALVRRVIRMVDAAEYKRRQSPPGPKITDRAFGRERRVPITSQWRT